MTNPHILIDMKKTLLLLLCVATLTAVKGQITKEANYDESKVPQYVLPDVLTCSDGSKVTDRKQWEKKRRPELLRMLGAEEYGFFPAGRYTVTCRMLKEDAQAFGGLATCQQIMFTFSGNGQSRRALLLAYVPNKRKGKVPVIIGYNFMGNQSTTPDTSLIYSPAMDLMVPAGSPDRERGVQKRRWPYEKILSRGYAVCTMYYCDIYPDEARYAPQSILPLLLPSSQLSTPHSPGAIGAWAWGSSRIADWVVRQPWADKKALILMGHSRQGKAALWAGANDKRFRIVISNESGCCGAALGRRQYGETVELILRRYAYWFCPALARYSRNEAQMPFDQHELIALMAPRPVYVASAEDDRWSDPKGEFLATSYAGAVYHLYGLKGLETDAMPSNFRPIQTTLGYHVRAGKHDVTDYDWEQYLNFCDKNLSR